MTEPVAYKIDAVPDMKFKVTSEDCVAITSDGKVLDIPKGTPIPDLKCIVRFDDEEQMND